MCIRASPAAIDSISTLLPPSFPCVRLLSILYLTKTTAEAVPSLVERGDSNPLNINWDPAPPPEEGPPLSANALRGDAYLPAQIGGIVGAYALSLVFVAIALLILSKKRREALKAGADEIDFETDYIPNSKETSQEGFEFPIPPEAFASYDQIYTRPEDAAPAALVPNFSYPSPVRTEFVEPGFYVTPSSPQSHYSAPGVHPDVDQSVVAADKAMAQNQLEEMYRHAFEHEEAKAKGVVLDSPVSGPAPVRYPEADKSIKSPTLSKKSRNKPASLNLSAEREEKTQSRTSSLFSALRSPKKKPTKGLSISSPIMTPQTATFPPQESQELGTIPPRHYAPAPPPPVPEHHASHQGYGQAPMTPDMSPQSTQSIDERIAVQLDLPRGSSHTRNTSSVPTEADPESATSYHSKAPLVGLPASPRATSFRGATLPSSPKPGVTFSQQLPSSPKPGASFSRPNAPSAVRTGGALPFRAYESSVASPTQQTTKQTVFERKGPLSPTTGRTPFTAGAVPYTPYQPFTPVVPMTPSLVTKDDRKRMKRLVPKTPTLEMVQSADETW